MPVLSLVPSPKSWCQAPSKSASFLKTGIQRCQLDTLLNTHVLKKHPNQRGFRGRGNIVYCVFTSYGEARGGEKMGGKFELQDDRSKPFTQCCQMKMTKNRRLFAKKDLR